MRPLLPLPVTTVVSTDTTAGSTLASTSCTSAGWTMALWFGKNFSTTVFWLRSATVAPIKPPPAAAMTAVSTTTRTQLRTVRVWRTRSTRGTQMPGT